MNWIIMAILGTLAISISRLLQKIVMSNKKSNPYAFGFVLQAFTALFLYIYVFFTRTWEFPTAPTLFFNFILMSIFYASANVFMYKAFQNAEASEISVILTSSTMWTVLTAIIVLGERLYLKSGLGIVFIVVGVLVIQDVKKGFRFNKFHLYALFSAILLGIAFINDIFIIKHYQNISPYLVLAMILPALSTIVFQPSAIMRVKDYFEIKILIPLLISAFFFSLSAILVYTSYKAGGNASTISSIQQTSAAFTIILAYIFLSERNNMKKKIIGCILTICGVLLLI